MESLPGMPTTPPRLSPPFKSIASQFGVVSFDVTIWKLPNQAQAKQLEEENGKLKKLVADLRFDKALRNSASYCFLRSHYPGKQF